MLGIIGILIALGLLMFLAYRGHSILLIAPITALIAVVFAGNVPIVASYTQIFMPATGAFIVQFFPLFMLGALFGKLMEDSGSAQTLSRWIIGRLGRQQAVLAVVLACGVLTYGGVSLFVVAFAVFPLAAQLFREANIPKRLIPATIGLGSFTFTMTALPGTPSIQNAIPMPFFGTTPFAAPVLGILAATIMFGLGMVWLNWRVTQARTANEGYSQTEDQPVSRTQELREHAMTEGFDIAEIADEERAQVEPPSFAVALAPLVLVIALNFTLVTFIIPALDTSYLADPEWGSTTIEAVRGLWAVIIALTASVIALIALNYQRIENLKATLNQGADASVLPIFNTASQVGFGAVIAALPAFAILSEAILSLGGDNPLIALAVSVGLLAAITASASGGMSIALDTLGDTYVMQAEAAGISLEVMHRVTVVAAGSIDSLPHSGAVITLLAVCGLTHRESYFDMFMVAVIGPVIALIALVIMGSLFGSF